MKHSIKSVLAWAAVAVMLVGCNSQPTAKRVLLKSYKKCQSIQGGHYEMTLKKKYMSDNDTTYGHYTCDFRKLTDDTIYGKVFNSFEEYSVSEWSHHYLYTGNEYAYFNDSTGTLMPCDLWAADIIRGRHNRTFYTPLTNKSSYPLRNPLELFEEGYSYTLSETRLD